MTIDTAGFQLDTTRSHYGGLGAETVDMIDVGLINLGHVHTCDGLLITLAGTSWTRPAELNPMFDYWIGQDASGRWSLSSSLGGWNVIGYVEQIDGAQLVDGEVYAIEHNDSTAGQPCSMTLRQAAQEEIPRR